MKRTIVPVIAIVIITALSVGAAYAYASQLHDDVGEASIVSQYGTAGIYSDASCTSETDRVSFTDGTFSAFLNYTDTDSSVSDAAVTMELHGIDPSLMGRTVAFTLGSQSYYGKVFLKDADYQCLINGITMELTEGSSGPVAFSVSLPSDPGHASLKICIFRYA